MSELRGPLFRLRARSCIVDVTISPLGQHIDRTSVRSSKSRESRITKLMRFRDRSIINAESAPLGMMVDDWQECGFELSPDTCELSYALEFRFQTDDYIYPKHCILGHAYEQERDR